MDDRSQRAVLTARRCNGTATALQRQRCCCFVATEGHKGASGKAQRQQRQNTYLLHNTATAISLLPVCGVCRQESDTVRESACGSVIVQRRARAVVAVAPLRWPCLGAQSTRWQCRDGRGGFGSSGAPCVLGHPGIQHNSRHSLFPTVRISPRAIRAGLVRPGRHKAPNRGPGANVGRRGQAHR